MARIIRVFITKTRATPDDENVRINCSPGMFDEADEVHISVLFTWDMNRALELADEWKIVAPVKIGGVATGERSYEFIAGKYVKHGYTITSRGCPNKCWFCSVPKREGGIRELPITEGWNVLDDNILACSETHIRSVFSMLKKQRIREFTGGFEAKILKDWHVDLIADIKPRQMFFAYDTPDDYEPLIIAGNKLKQVGISKSSMRAYCLIGSPNDTFSAAEKRLTDCINAGFLPMAMLWRNEKGERDIEWSRFQRSWARPAIIRNKINKGVTDV